MEWERNVEWARLIHRRRIDICYKTWNGVYYMNMKTSPNDVSNQEILEALGSFATSVDERFDRIEGKINGIGGEIVGIKGEVAGIKGEIAGIKQVIVTKDELRTELGRLKTTMVTKGYLDDKLADFHSDVIRHTRKEIEKAMK